MHTVRSDREQEAPMTWIKPEFEIIDLCSEVTSYLYKR
jgi:coenzyme PQQ precursor peptide PqqA